MWSDVDGLMTADPKIVSEARVIREASFAEALEMALFGAKYMHPRALEPAIESNIPMRVRNFMKIDDDGTLVVNNPSKDSHKIVKSITLYSTHRLDRRQWGWNGWCARDCRKNLRYSG